jgi:serine/threonine protein kinase
MLELLEHQHNVVNRVKGLIDTQTISEELDTLGEGLSGQVFGIDDLAVKVFKDGSNERKDNRMLSYLDENPFFPKIVYHDEQNFMIVERINGVTLSQYLRQGGKITSKHHDQVDQLVDGLYKKRVLPSDLHLNNIMIDENEQLKVVDVGRFKVLAESNSFYRTQLSKKKKELFIRLNNQYYAGSPLIDIDINISIGDINISFPSW